MAFKPYDPVAAHHARMNAQADADWHRRNPDPTRIPKMPSTSQMIVSKFIGHADVDPPLVVTIKNCTLESVGRDDEKEDKWFLWFNEHKKGMRLNVTTIRILEAAYGMHTDQWIGRRIKLYWDPGVMMAGKAVGGVRVKLPTAPGGAGVPPGARFDPNTGAPIVAAAVAPRFDSMTGQPLQPAAPGPRFDPNTGAPLGGTAAPAAAATPPVDEFGTPTGPAGEFIDDEEIPF
jgi:hypothetical protein